METTRLTRVLRTTARRLRVRRSLPAASLTFAVVALLRVGLDPEPPAALAQPLAVAAILLLPGLLAALVAALWPVEGAAVARALDQSHHLPDTIQAARQFSARSGTDPSGFVGALLRRAEVTAARLSPAKAIPVRPLPSIVAVLIGVAVTLLNAASPDVSQATARKGNRVNHAPTAATAGPRESAEEREPPLTRYRRIASAVTQGSLPAPAAIRALLALEQSTARVSDALEKELVDRLGRWFSEGTKARPRTLASLSQELTESPLGADERAAQKRLLDEKRRELERLRAQHANDTAAARELAELAKHLEGAQNALRQDQPASAASELQSAQRRLDELKKRRAEQQGAQTARREAGQLRELMQRRAKRPHDGEERAEQSESDEPAGTQTGSQDKSRREDVEGSLAQAPAPRAGAGGGSDGPSPSNEPDLFASSARPRVRLEDHAATSQLGDGASRSEVILTAADRGFATEAYRKVYVDYLNHSEQLLERDRVPAGQRFYVRRYFQLIGPRGGRE